MEYDERTATTVRRTLKQSYNKRHVQYYFHLHHFNHHIQSVFIVHSWQLKMSVLYVTFLYFTLQLPHCSRIYTAATKPYNFWYRLCRKNRVPVALLFLGLLLKLEAALSASLPSAILNNHIHTNVTLKIDRMRKILFLVSQWWNNQLN